jgi:ABC-type nitrate/sulfonate/bicarbonate transport system permease component
VRWRDFGLGLVTTLILWQLLAWAVGRPVLPPPTRVLAAFAEEILSGLGRHFLISAWRVSAAILVAVLTAVPLGLGLGQIGALNRLFAPLIYIVYPIPKIVFLPVVLVLLGSGDTSKIFLIAIILFFQILVVVRDAAANLRPELILSVRSIGAGRRALYRYVYFPAAIPAVLTALRVSVGTAIAVLFIAESFATTSGLGYYIITETWAVLKYAEMYAGVLAMSMLGLSLYFVIDLLDHRLCPWREAET